MAKANNLELQGGTYHVRLDIPKDVQASFGGRRILSQSLKTGVHKEALDRRLPILAKWKSQIRAAREGTPLPDDWQDNLASHVVQIDELTKKFKMESIGIKTDLPTIDPVEVAQVMRDYPAIVSDITDKVRQAISEGPMSLIRFNDHIAEKFKEAAADRLTTNYRLTPEQQAEVNVLIANPANYKSRSPITATRLKTFRAHREAHHIAPKTIAQQESKLLDLSRHLKESQMPLDFDAVSAWLGGMDLSSKTKQQYLLAGSMFWKWAIKHDTQWREAYKNHVNPFEKHDLPQLKGKAKKDAARKAFTIEELRTLHVAAQEHGLNTLADLILLGSYTGARLEELCQLRTENLIKVDGILSFDITDAKTAAGIRVVPVHPALSNLVARLAAESKDGYLVPSKSRNQYGIRSDALSKAFGRLKKAMGFGPLHVFHSIRASAITHLVRADVADRLIKELVGHETGSVTFDVYSQGASAAQKLEAISKLPVLSA